MSTAASVTPFSSGAEEESYITTAAHRLGLDPKALLAVAAHEGVQLPAEIGDQGHAFGPWQMNDAVGVLKGVFPNWTPAELTAWANSPAGIDYALEGIAGVAKGLTGNQAIVNIVSRYERPADIPGEIASSESSYAAGQGPQLVSKNLYVPPGAPTQPGTPTPPSSPGTPPNTKPGEPGYDKILHAVEAPINTISGVFTSIEAVFSFIFSYRFLEILGGIGLVGIGLVLVGRQFSVAPPAAATNAARSLAGR